MGALFGDLRYSVRSLAKDRAFTLVAVLTLTVCLGANVALFVVVHSILLRPLPVPEADRIVLMSNQYPNSAPERSDTSMVADYVDRLEQTTVFEEQAIFTTLPRTLELDSAPERVQVLATTASLFRLLRATPAIGRVFTDQDVEDVSLGRLACSSSTPPARSPPPTARHAAFWRTPMDFETAMAASAPCIRLMMRRSRRPYAKRRKQAPAPALPRAVPSR